MISKQLLDKAVDKFSVYTGWYQNELIYQIVGEQVYLKFTDHQGVNNLTANSDEDLRLVYKAVTKQDL